MGTKLNIAKVVEPKDRPSQQEWFRQFNVSTSYIAPTPYFKENYFDSQVFLKKRSSRSILSGISNLLNIFSWAV